MTLEPCAPTHVFFYSCFFFLRYRWSLFMYFFFLFHLKFCISSCILVPFHFLFFLFELEFRFVFIVYFLENLIPIFNFICTPSSLQSFFRWFLIPRCFFVLFILWQFLIFKRLFLWENFLKGVLHFWWRRARETHLQTS